jgi:hypothetical protein
VHASDADEGGDEKMAVVEKTGEERKWAEEWRGRADEVGDSMSDEVHLPLPPLHLHPGGREKASTTMAVVVATRPIAMTAIDATMVVEP